VKQIKSLEDLLPDDRNLNRHTERGTGALETSLREYGAGRSIVIDRNGKTICGNATLEGAASIGLENIQVIPTDGNTLVVVQRTDLDLDNDARARGLAIADNRVGELNLDLDYESLAQQVKEFNLDLSQVGFTREELDRLIKESANESQENESAGAEAAPGMADKYMILVQCRDESQQVELLEKFMGEGLQCRALIG